MRFEWQALKTESLNPDDESTTERYVYSNKDSTAIFDNITEKIEDKYSLFKQENS